MGKPYCVTYTNSTLHFQCWEIAFEIVFVGAPIKVTSNMLPSWQKLVFLQTLLLVELYIRGLCTM